MKARLLKKWGTNYAGQVLTNIEKGALPAGVAEYFDDEDPAVMTVRDEGDASDPLMVVNDEINPNHAKEHNEAQRAKAKAASATDKASVASAVEALEQEQTQERARHADKVAAQIDKAGHDTKGALSKGQKENNAAGKGPAKTKK